MKCPVDPDQDLVMSERQGVEIDYCPKCRGVWLDRGELDKILERASRELAAAAAAPAPGAPAPPAPATHAPPPPYPPVQGQYSPQGHYPPPGSYPPRGYEGDYYKKKRKKSFFEEIFD